METATKKCKKCGVEKELVGFPTRTNAKGVTHYKHTCKACVKEYNNKYCEENKEEIAKQKRSYREENKEEIAKQKKLHYEENKEEISKQHKLYYEENKEEILKNVKEYQEENKVKIAKYQKSYYEENKETIIKKSNENQNKRRKTDPSFRLRKNISHFIRQAIKNNGGSKKGQSCIKKLGYTINELKEHIEKLFVDPQNLTSDGKIWMTWENWGVYDSNTWNDDDPSTWTWQIDHIIAQSKLPYDSMEHPNFLKCWSLENLRPYSAKKNILKGNRREVSI